MVGTIHGKMLKEHEQIIDMLGDFENLLKVNSQASEKSFNKLKWNLEKHFFIEEKILYGVYNSGTEEENAILLSLLKDHKDILWLMNLIEDSFSERAEENIDEIKNILKSHVSVENEFFYPRLDEELDREKRNFILERIEEIIID